VITSTSIEDLVGSAFGLKMFCDENIKVIGIAKDGERRIKKVGHIHTRYVDKLCINVSEFDTWLSSFKGW
jgi:hypothetical protein